MSSLRYTDYVPYHFFAGYSVIFISTVAGGGAFMIMIIVLSFWVCGCCKSKQRVLRNQRSQLALAQPVPPVVPTLIFTHEALSRGIRNPSAYDKDVESATAIAPVASPVGQPISYIGVPMPLPGPNPYTKAKRANHRRRDHVRNSHTQPTPDRLTPPAEPLPD